MTRPPRPFPVLTPRASRTAWRERSQQVLWRTGILPWLGRREGAAGTSVLMFHSVTGDWNREWIDPGNAIDVRRFESYVSFLRRRRNPVAINTLVEAIERGETLPAGSVVVTFDDGYLDTLELAAPILSAYAVPAVLYLATGYISRTEPQWIDELYSAVATRTRHELVVDEASDPAFDLRNTQSLRDAYSLLKERFIEADLPERREFLSEVKRQLGPALAPPRLTLSWADVREIQSRFPGIELGVHTADHVDLSRWSEERVEREVRACVDDFTRELGYRPKHFSYPYGRSTETAANVVRRLGFRSAVLAHGRELATASTDLLGIGRFSVPDSMGLLGLYTSGAYPVAWDALRRAFGLGGAGSTRPANAQLGSRGSNER